MKTRKSTDRKIEAREINVAEQLQKINLAANELLDTLTRWNRGEDEALQILESQVRKVRVGKGQNAEEITEYRLSDPRKLVLQVMHEIREQAKLQVEILQVLYGMQAVKEFKEEVLEIMENVSPESRDEIIRRLAEKNALRSSLGLHDIAPATRGSQN